MQWHLMTSPELDALDRDTVVVLPLGSCEQHGRHLPLLTDTLEVEAIAAAVEQQRCDRVLVAPTLWLGSSHHHRDYPGTLSVRPSVYARMIQDLVMSVVEAGFSRVLLLNGHGGNEAPAAEALSELVATKDRADEAWLVIASWWNIAQRSLTAKCLGMSTPSLDHACEYETSLVLFLRPDLVRRDRVADSEPLFHSGWMNGEAGGRVQVFKRFHRLTETGTSGCPSSASPEKGRAIHQAVVGDVVRLLDEMRQWPNLPIRSGRQVRRT